MCFEKKFASIVLTIEGTVLCVVTKLIAQSKIEIPNLCDTNAATLVTFSTIVTVLVTTSPNTSIYPNNTDLIIRNEKRKVLATANNKRQLQIISKQGQCYKKSHREPKSTTIK